MDTEPLEVFIRSVPAKAVPARIVMDPLLACAVTGPGFQLARATDTLALLVLRDTGPVISSRRTGPLLVSHATGPS